jgi:hypothetical protein
MLCQFSSLETGVTYVMSVGSVRYLRVGGTRKRHFTGTNSKPHKLPENAATPTRRVHAVLGGFNERQAFLLFKASSHQSH